MNETALGCECKSTKEQSVGGQLLDMARRIASEAEIMSKATEDKLSPITKMPEPKVAVMDETKAGQQVWPPYFDEMRAILKDIARFIRDTQRTIKRVEL
ncbi:MAG: hypothetical protein WC910_08585 [Bacteroidales bacterium]|jgi:hypothetical protein